MTEPSSVPKYRAIAADLRQKIATGTYPVGGQLPTKSELMAQYGVALNTVDRALDVLRELGLVDSRQGVGTFVLTSDPGQAADLSTRVAQLEEQMAEVLKRLEQPPSGA